MSPCLYLFCVSWEGFNFFLVWDLQSFLGIRFVHKYIPLCLIFLTAIENRGFSTIVFYLFCVCEDYWFYMLILYSALLLIFIIWVLLIFMEFFSYTVILCYLQIEVAFFSLPIFKPLIDCFYLIPLANTSKYSVE